LTILTYGTIEAWLKNCFKNGKHAKLFTEHVILLISLNYCLFKAPTYLIFHLKSNKVNSQFPEQPVNIYPDRDPLGRGA
jgi:hypothetical protein